MNKLNLSLNDYLLMDDDNDILIEKKNCLPIG